ncbi:MAG TPA: hypothetical protein VKN73_08550 [Desulfosalsimonadaceae bacterium]|nr:hypothetical protein [Desulfosalsimonadaceae bacterium]
MTEQALKNLETALKPIFSDEEAGYLARLLYSFSPNDTIYYENIDLPDSLKDDYILMAYEERLIVPQSSRPGGAWEDRMLRLESGALYIMPRVIRQLLDLAESTGTFDSARAIRQTMAEMDEGSMSNLLTYFNKLKGQAVSYKVEGGLLDTLNQETNPPLDLHATVDLFVLLGMMSPCTRGPITSGLVWYEINPSLYWGE